MGVYGLTDSHSKDMKTFMPVPLDTVVSCTPVVFVLLGDHHATQLSFEVLPLRFLVAAPEDFPSPSIQFEPKPCFADFLSTILSINNLDSIFEYIKPIIEVVKPRLKLVDRNVTNCFGACHFCKP